MRKKVKLAFIPHEPTRKVTYKKRKMGILKKVSELSILCGVPACAIIYGEKETEPVLWPPSPVSVREVISKFLDMPVMEQSKKMVNQEGFLLQRVVRLEEQLKKQRKDNREREMTCLMFRGMDGLMPPGWIQGLSVLDLVDLEWLIDETLNQIEQMQQLSEPGPKQVARAIEVVDTSTSEESTGLIEPLDSDMQTLKDDIINPSNTMFLNNFIP